MNFRQRVAWVLVAIFLAATCGMAYYIFEISDRFSEYALEHVESYHSASRRAAAERELGGGASAVRGVAGIVGGVPLHGGEADNNNRPRDTWLLVSFFRHLMDIPLAVWMMLLVLPYLQIFCLLLACTKAEPRYSPAYLWPLFLYLKCRTLYHRWTHPVSKAFNSPLANGHHAHRGGQHGLLIDT